MASMDVFKVFVFEASHRLPNVDFVDIKRASAPLHDRLDRNFPNEIQGLSNPTSEALARWNWRYLQPILPGLCKVLLRETCTWGCIYQGKDR